MDLLGIKVDPAKVAGGVWWSIWREPDNRIGGKSVDDPGEGPALLIVPALTAYERALDDARRPHLYEIREGKVSDAVLRKIQGEALGRAVLRGWRGLVVGGQPLPWSEDKAVELMTDDAWLSLREFVQSAANWRAALAAQEVAKAAGN
jgi:hypothetical protein